MAGGRMMGTNCLSKRGWRGIAATTRGRCKIVRTLAPGACTATASPVLRGMAAGFGPATWNRAGLRWRPMCRSGEASGAAASGRGEVKVRIRARQSTRTRKKPCDLAKTEAFVQTLPTTGPDTFVQAAGTKDGLYSMLLTLPAG